MTTSSARQTHSGISKSAFSGRRQQPPAPLRTHSATDTIIPEQLWEAQVAHTRHKSSSLASGVSRANPRYARRASEQPAEAQRPGQKSHRAPDSIPENTALDVPGAYGVFSPPLTPIQSRNSCDSSKSSDSETANQIAEYDFSKLDYELDRAKVIGTGLWSTVYLADGKASPRLATGRSPPSPPTTPDTKRHLGPSSLFAVKTPARADAKDVFRQEAKVLTHLVEDLSASQFIVPFRGLDTRNCALVFDAVIGGSLETLNSRLQQMTEIGRHLELVNIFPGLADDLISGLEFMHRAGVVHADIKPANILLDISDHYSLPRPVIRARYIDFSASFRIDSDDSTANAGGTWDYMAPEQLRLQKELKVPTFASDIWSLGVTLLTLIVGGSPYTDACGNNPFMLREAIKTGDPLSFARMNPKARKRLAACQDYIDCCRQALKKDRERRLTAAAWKQWLISQEFAM
ncbi:hypothetical protein LTR78_001414 [Recurvomyces mirabilis]|uniref:Autophagy-related protein 1 n=1 Tax=Recurvomyces mirabilis TaxID=574656 RepID=A0AAE1C5I7_9PEZI|nr:hypothetical protein LTR78_001414 [Recurvomyces mirabilis]KAK5161391.1 hypothetical protein LTS14_001187 [Recurvomyces mirabilis]